MQSRPSHCGNGTALPAVSFFASSLYFLKKYAIMKQVFSGSKAVPCTGKSGPESNRRGVFCYEQNHHPANYTPALNLYDTQRAIGTVKRLFADTLCATLNLYRVSAPLFLEASTGLNDA